MPTILSEQPKKVPNLTPLNPPTQNTNGGFNNLKNPFKKGYGPKMFGEMSKSTSVTPTPIKIPVPGEGLPRVIHYCADQSGCAFWRLIWPADELLAHNKAVVMTLYQMVADGHFYGGIDAIRLQRQCTDMQVGFIKFLRKVSDDMKKQTGKGFRLIWEVDDVILPASDIPDYNICKTAFTEDTIHKNVLEAMKYVDEMSVPSEYMRQHYQKHLNFDKISVIPNYAPKNWIDRGYDKDKVMDIYRKHKSKPRVLYAGSGTHFDVSNKVNQQDDFAGVVDMIADDIMNKQKYEWVFLGAIPLKLRQFIGRGIEFHPWCAITDYPDTIKKLNVNISIAPLQDNAFSRSKANIKLTEAGMQGIPCVAQNIACYNYDGWKYLFNNSTEMFEHIDNILSDESTYENAVDTVRKYAEEYILQDHLDELVLLYTTPFGDSKRKENVHFLRNNPTQFNS